MAVTTSVVVNFGTSSSAGTEQQILRAEVDTRENGLNGGKNQFDPGDPVYILTYRYNVSSVQAVASAGSVVQGSSGTRAVTEDVVFADEEESTVQYPISAISSVQWLGNSLGGLTSLGGNRVKASQKGVAVARVTYTAPYVAYRLESPASVAGTTDFSIVVVFTGT